ncbi:MAG TPA: type II toxin-antitoxin system VapC family toxin [Tepidisphaeraceae bacterium]|nr:type II toxin-antitoxin system VapC family toxin [Tepidisphaeraceae bacterium]
MRLLLDTHAFLWYVLDDPKLSAAAKTAINDPDTDILVSPASYWEIAIKISINKYLLSVPYEEFWRHGIGDNDFDVLPIDIAHTGALLTLPFHHKDPFDRLLVAQAIVEKIPLVSADAVLDAYPIIRVW